MWTGSRGHSGIGQMFFFPFLQKGFQPLLASAGALVAKMPTLLWSEVSLIFQENCLSLISRDQTSFAVPAKWVWAPWEWGWADPPAAFLTICNDK